jgi:hypothetical protein
MTSDFQTVFQRLRKILQKHAGVLAVTEDAPTTYCLAGGLHPTHKKPMSIMWLHIGKAYVSYHLMPVYGMPQLLKGVSDQLKKRMQGKACFNFKEMDEDLFLELEQLTADSLKAFKKMGFMLRAKS